ncbi:MAG: DUF58 domain-containing protein [Candidatus Poribacteria bacterium]|nr:DUF58 domain-containing protein [Candidatus Poribacteria bacterium]
MLKNNATTGVYTTLEELIRLEYKAKGFSFLPRHAITSLLSGRHTSRLRGRGLNFEELRAYLPGDDIRTIDWKVTARTRKPHVRIYTEERDRPAILVVDQRMSMFFGSQTRMKSVTAAQLAALSAWRIFLVGDRVGAIVFNDSEIKEARPHRSRQRVLQILQSIVYHNNELRADSDVPRNPSMLNRALEGASRLASHDYLIGIISDFDGMDDETRRIMIQLAQHNDVIAALIYDPLAMQGLPGAGRFVVSQGQLQVEVDFGRTRVREPLSDYFAERIQNVEERLKKVGIPVLPINTADDVTEQLRHLLGNRPGSR